MDLGNHGMLYPIGSMYAIYANIWGIWMVNVTIHIAYMDPMGKDMVQKLCTSRHIFCMCY